MQTTQDKLQASRIRSEVYTLRYANSTYAKQLKLIDESIADLTLKLSMRPASSGLLTTARMESVLESLKDRGKELYNELYGINKADLRELADYESVATADAIAGAYPIKMVVDKVAPNEIYSAAMSRPFQGKILRDWYQDQEYAVRQLYKSQIKYGFSQGESLGQIIARVKNVGNKERKEIESIVRTAAMHMSNRAMIQTTKNNQDLFAGDVLITTLDGRTSHICRGLPEGKVYKHGSGPVPPLHFNCRTIRIGKTKSWTELGFDGMDEDAPLSDRPFVADKRKVKDIPKDQRDSVIGRTDAGGWNTFGRTQPRFFVEDVLGKTKAKLYLDGKLDLDKFVDRTGAELTIDELYSKHKKAFDMAGIEWQ